MNVGFILRMARRDTRSGARRLALLAAGVTAGVAALVAINGFTSNLRDSIASQARQLLGADLSFEARAPLPGLARTALDSIGGTESEVTSFSAMAYAGGSETARLTQMSAVTGGWPFYGAIETTPAGAWSQLQLGRHVIVDPSLLSSLGVQVGDSISVGATRLEVIGTIAAVPGDVGVRNAFGPRAFMRGADLDATGLLGFGARVEHAVLVQLPPGADAQSIAEKWRLRLRDLRVRIRTVADDQARLDNALTRLSNFLALVALVALLLGGLGVASAVHVHIRGKLPSVAMLRCLGATSGQMVGVYLVQAGLLALIGSLAGAAIGLLVQKALPALLGDFVPVDVAFHPSWSAAAVGTVMGLWVAIAFALLPLLEVRRVPPLAALRQDVSARPGRDWWRLGTLAALGLTILLLSIWQSRSVRTGIVFALAALVVLALLRLTALLLMAVARRLAPALPFAARQGILNLRRPSNQTSTVILAIGFGAFLLATVLLVQHTLLRTLDVSSPSSGNANMVFFDIQPSQLAGTDSMLRAAGVVAAPPVAIVPMRIASVRGIPVSTLQADTLREGRWALRREYRSTWRDTMVASEKLVAGHWWSGPAGDTTRISVEEDVAGELGVSVGDGIVWDVQGSRIPSVVASIRSVDWARFEPNFFVVFQPGALEEAPHTWVVLARVPRPESRGLLSRQIAERYPNITSLDLTLIQGAIASLLGKVTLAIRFMALFSLITGLVVLVGAIATSRFQRVREAALLRTLGASRGQLTAVALAEYAALGAVSALAALLLGGIAAWSLSHWIFQVPFSVPVGAAVILVAATALVTMVVGLWTALDVARQTPLGVLRGMLE
ncbi:MAG TPA: FtsX-like permease family protein [Gemmatimonadales bacterium]|nr:FtsX-like permease family protein [Gemmatimonadales bacterium]